MQERKGHPAVVSLEDHLLPANQHSSSRRIKARMLRAFGSKSRSWCIRIACPAETHKEHVGQTTHILYCGLILLLFVQCPPAPPDRGRNTDRASEREKESDSIGWYHQVDLLLDYIEASAVRQCTSCFWRARNVYYRRGWISLLILHEQFSLSQYNFIGIVCLRKILLDRWVLSNIVRESLGGIQSAPAKFQKCSVTWCTAFKAIFFLTSLPYCLVSASCTGWICMDRHVLCFVLDSDKCCVLFWLSFCLVSSRCSGCMSTPSVMQTFLVSFCRCGLCAISQIVKCLSHVSLALGLLDDWLRLRAHRCTDVTVFPRAAQR